MVRQLFDCTLNPIESQAQQILNGWIPAFAQYDKNLTWLEVETAKFLWVNDYTLLCGVVDANFEEGFGEWKTANPRSAKTWRRDWILNPQSLSYGLLSGKRKHLVRKAFKSPIPTFDHEWFELSERDLQNWRRQVELMGEEIKKYLGLNAPWPQNFKHGCFAFGPSYPCPYWQHGCGENEFVKLPPDTVPFEFFPEFTDNNRTSLLNEIALWKMRHPNEVEPIVLSPSRIDTWMRCREMYRRSHAEHIQFQPSEAMLLGSAFHSLIAQHNRSYIKKETT